MDQIQHRVGDEELEHRDPEVVVLEVGAEVRAKDRPCQSLHAAESVDLPPAQAPRQPYNPPEPA